jgi:hypothetical protein
MWFLDEPEGTHRCPLSNRCAACRMWEHASFCLVQLNGCPAFMLEALSRTETRRIHFSFHVSTSICTAVAVWPCGVLRFMNRIYSSKTVCKARARKTIVFHYKLMEQSPSWDANRFSASKEISPILWKSNVNFRFHERPPPVYSEPDQSSPCLPHPTSWRSILILFSHLRLWGLG